MIHTIDARLEKLKREIEEELYGEDVRLETLEKGLHEAIERTVSEIVSDYYEAIDESLREDMPGIFTLGEDYVNYEHKLFHEYIPMVEAFKRNELNEDETLQLLQLKFLMNM